MSQSHLHSGSFQQTATTKTKTDAALSAPVQVFLGPWVEPDLLFALCLTNRRSQPSKAPRPESFNSAEKRGKTNEFAHIKYDNSVTLIIISYLQGKSSPESSWS